MSELVLVAGATGQQGGAVARELLKQGVRVRGLARSTTSERAKKLTELGAEVVVGDLTSVDSLAAAMDAVDIVFAVTTPFEVGVEGEVQQGKNLVDAAKRVGVKHFIYTSVANADKETGIPHFDSKYEVERYLAASGLNGAVMAPVYFMENLFMPQNLDGLKAGSYGVPMPKERKLQQIAVDDIGAFGAYMVTHAEQMTGKRIDIAGDELSAEQSAAALAAVLDRSVVVTEVPMDGIRAFSEDLALMYEWFISTGYSADVDGLRTDFPEVPWTRFDAWAERHGTQLAGAQ